MLTAKLQFSRKKEAIYQHPALPPQLPSSQLEAARFILKLRDGNGLPQTVTDSIVE